MWGLGYVYPGDLYVRATLVPGGGGPRALVGVEFDAKGGRSHGVRSK